MEETKTLQEEFAEKAKEFLLKTYPPNMTEFVDDATVRVLSVDDLYEDVMQEIHWQIADWYEGCSYYPKPEDILVDFLQLSPNDAHRFLPLFAPNCEGKDSCPL